MRDIRVCGTTLAGRTRETRTHRSPPSGVAAVTLLLLSVLAGGCSREVPAPATRDQRCTTAPAPRSVRPSRREPERNAYFGDVHVHTAGRLTRHQCSRTTPTDAYAWAQAGDHQQRLGRQDPDPDAARLLHGAEHAEFMGVFNQMSNPRVRSARRAGQGRQLARPVVRCRHFRRPA